MYSDMSLSDGYRYSVTVLCMCVRSQKLVVKILRSDGMEGSGITIFTSVFAVE